MEEYKRTENRVIVQKEYLENIMFSIYLQVMAIYAKKMGTNPVVIVDDEEGCVSFLWLAKVVLALLLRGRRAGASMVLMFGP